MKQAIEDEKRLSKQSKQTSAFAGFAVDSDSDDQEEEQPQVEEVKQKQEPKSEAPKKKKSKRKRAKKAKQEELTEQDKKLQDLDAFLDEVVKQTQEKSAVQKYSDCESILSMERGFFNHKKELKQLFAKAMGTQGAKTAALAEEAKREVQPELLEGYSKKMKRMILLQEKLKQRNRVVVFNKKQVLCTPDPKWPRIDAAFLSMKQVATDSKTGNKVFSFVKSPEYLSLQKEFARVQATCDIQALADFLRQNFYHHESLIFIADYLRLQGKFSDAAGFLERCLFAFEQAFSFDFQFVPGS